MGWKVVGVAALAACCTVFLGSASASAPPGPTSAVKSLGVIKRTASTRPGLRAAAPATSTGSSTPSNFALNPTLQLTYHGGPVMHTHTLYVIYWQPSGFNFGADAAASTAYKNLINQYVQDVAADSGKTS